MKKILADNNLTVMATVARYAAAYEAIAKPVRSSRHPDCSSRDTDCRSSFFLLSGLVDQVDLDGTCDRAGNPFL